MWVLGVVMPKAASLFRQEPVPSRVEENKAELEPNYRTDRSDRKIGKIMNEISKRREKVIKRNNANPAGRNNARYRSHLLSKQS